MCVRERKVRTLSSLLRNDARKDAEYTRISAEEILRCRREVSESQRANAEQWR